MVTDEEGADAGDDRTPTDTTEATTTPTARATERPRLRFPMACPRVTCTSGGTVLPPGPGSADRPSAADVPIPADPPSDRGRDRPARRRSVGPQCRGEER